MAMIGLGFLVGFLCFRIMGAHELESRISGRSHSLQQADVVGIIDEQAMKSVAMLATVASQHLFRPLPAPR